MISLNSQIMESCVIMNGCAYKFILDMCKFDGAEYTPCNLYISTIIRDSKED